MKYPKSNPKQKQPPEVLYKKDVLKNFKKLTGKQLLPLTCNFIKKETLRQVFSCKFCKVFKNTFFTEHLPLTASSKRLNLLFTVRQINCKKTIETTNRN